MREGVLECECRRIERLNAKALEVPEFYTRYGKPLLSEIKPQTKPNLDHPRMGYSPDQPHALTKLRAAPDRSWLLIGRRNGCGKSFLGWSLWWYGVMSGRLSIACTLGEFIDTYRAWEMTPDWEKGSDRPNSRPRLLPADLKTPVKRTLFIDECDKLSNVTPYVSQLFFTLVSNIRDYGHQLIVCTNLDWESLSDMWSRQGETYGNSIMRRLGDIFDGGIIELK